MIRQNLVCTLFVVNECHFQVHNFLFVFYLKNVLKQFDETKQKEKEYALEQLRVEMEKDTEKKLSQLAQKYGKEIDNKLHEIDELTKQMEKVNGDLCDQEELNKKYVTKLEALLSSYQEFINAQPGFFQGQAEFLLQDFSTDVTEDKK